MLPLRIILDLGESELKDGPHPERARRDAEVLLLRALGKDRAWLMAHRSSAMSVEKHHLYVGYMARRLAGEPIQYILGEAEFYGLPFRVTPAVLIPRPETEHLVEKALELAASFPSPRILDIGTGSGAIAVAVAHQLANQESSGKGTGFSPYISNASISGALAPEGRSLSVTAIDISPEALAVARENASRNGVSIRFLEGDLLAPVEGEQFEIILSNPPYIPPPDRPTLSVEVRDHEPSLALFAGEDGLGIYRRLIPAAFQHLVPGGFLLLEIGYGQQPEIENLLANSGFTSILFLPDLQNIPRVACARRAVSV